MDATPGFEASLQRLEEAIAALEGGDLGLDEALARYEEGVRLLGRCKDLLDGAERRVELLIGLDGRGNAETSPFETQLGPDRIQPDE
jgi:exodeoxyribonuclease VII small subunit